MSWTDDLLQLPTDANDGDLLQYSEASAAWVAAAVTAFLPDGNNDGEVLVWNAGDWLPGSPAFGDRPISTTGTMQSGGDDGLILGSAAPDGAIISTSEANASWQGITVESYTTLGGVNTLTFLRARGGAKATPAAAQSGDSVFNILAGAYDGASWCVPFQWEFVLNAAPAYPQARGVLTLYTSDGEARQVFSDVAGTRTTKLPDLGGGTDLPVCADAQGVLSKRDLVNADIDAAAAIAGTKVAPNFGAQNISTTGDCSVNDITAVRHITASGTVDVERLTVTSVLHVDESDAKIGFFSVAGVPVVQQSVTAITDGTGGTANGSLASISGTGDDTNLNNNFADLAAKYNSVVTFLQTYGLSS